MHLLSLFSILISVGIVKCHECYVCTNQDGNREKCLNTIMSCGYGEDYCLSDVRWKSTPYLIIGVQKIYFVSKQCATKAMCEQRRTDTRDTCRRISYNDWYCSECCKGDRCNYYVTLGASSVTGDLVTLTVMSLAALLSWLWHL